MQSDASLAGRLWGQRLVVELSAEARVCGRAAQSQAAPKTKGILSSRPEEGCRTLGGDRCWKAVAARALACLAQLTFVSVCVL